MADSKKLWIFAGEASGDMYGARLAEDAKKESARLGKTLEIAGMGGPKMRAVGVQILVDSTELGVMGFIEVLKLIFSFVHIFFQLVKQARQARPDAVVLIDYPGFHLLFALAMYFSKIKVIWYISPKVWVWGKWRKPVLSKICTRMLLIFPFEQDVYAGTGLDAVFVGNPLLDIVKERMDPAVQRDKDLFVLLPGSRTMEVTRLLRPMLDCVRELKKQHSQLRFAISAPREKLRGLCESIIAKYREAHPDLPEVTLDCGRTSYYLQAAGTGLATSGTVTVECAIAGLPLVVCYKLNLITILVAAVLVKLYRGYFTMVDIIVNKTVFEEFLQYDAEKKKMLPAIEKILPGGSRRAEVEAGMKEMVELLSPPQSDHATMQAVHACFEVIGLE